jgi:hypothetical protein
MAILALLCGIMVWILVKNPGAKIVDPLILLASEIVPNIIATILAFVCVSLLVLPPAFARKLSEAEDEKIDLANHLVRKVLSKDMPIFVDGGTTMYYMGLQVREQYRKIPIVTNNLPLSLALCEEDSYPCIVVPGVPEREYAAILGPLANRFIDGITGSPALGIDDSARRCLPVKTL